LLKIGFAVNVMNDDFNTPVFMAVLANNQKSVAILIEYGADLNCRNNQGFMPFDLIADLDEWLKFAYFNEETKARLKGEACFVEPGLVDNFRPSFCFHSLQLQAHARSHQSHFGKGRRQADLLRLPYRPQPRHLVLHGQARLEVAPIVRVQQSHEHQNP
jgi:hypothetical protein